MSNAHERALTSLRFACHKGLLDNVLLLFPSRCVCSRLRHFIVSKDSSLMILLLLAALPPPLQPITVHLATPSGGGTMTTMSAHQHQQHHGFDLPYPFRKFPLSINVAAAANVEFNDEFTASTSNSMSTRSSMRTQRQMKTPQRHTTCITFSTYLLPAQHLPLLQHFQHTFPHPPPPPMEGEQGVSQVAYTTATNNTRSFLPSLQ